MNGEVIRDSMHLSQVERGAHVERLYRDELVERITRAISEDGRVEPLKGLTLHRSSSPTEPLHSLSYPSLCIITQGSKEVHLAGHRYQYDPYHYLLVAAELPVVSQVLEASKERPYLSLVLTLDPTTVSSVMVEAGHATPPNRTNVRAINVSPVSASLIDAVVRLVRLLEAPDEAKILASLIMQEIVYRLLRGEQGERLRHIMALEGETQHIARALKRLHEAFDQPIRIESLAEELGMSVSSFHVRFKAVTEMSPLQFQKRVRLQEARRLLLAEHLDAASTAYRVGYNDVSHFTRDYKRLFGEPPMRDVERLRQTALVVE